MTSIAMGVDTNLPPCFSSEQNMQFQVIRKIDYSPLIRRALSDDEIAHLARRSNRSDRMTIYGIPLCFLVWVIIAAPDVAPEVSALSLWQFFGFAVSIIVGIPVVHEFIHLLGMPSKIFLSDTKFIVRLDGIHSNCGVSFGGRYTREQMVLTSLLPLAVLTVTPFTLLLYGFKLPLLIGIAASYNFGLSSLDVLQSIGMLNAIPRGTILSRDQLVGCQGQK